MTTVTIRATQIMNYVDLQTNLRFLLAIHIYRHGSIPIVLCYWLCSTKGREGPGHQDSGMHCQLFLVQERFLVFCSADEDTGKTSVDTYNLTG